MWSYWPARWSYFSDTLGLNVRADGAHVPIFTCIKDCVLIDPCCGSGGMFVQSAEFIKRHKGNKKDITIYGQESNDKTYKLARMNLAIRGLNCDLGDMDASTFTSDKHPNLRADFILANPPFNLKDWRTENELRNDRRWDGYEVPPVSNANYAWILHMLARLSYNGTAAFLLANGALGADSEEYKIRKQLIENHKVEAIIVLPREMFYATDISVALKEDIELVNLFQSQLTDTCYPDPELKTLTIDVGFYISRYYSQKDAVAQADAEWFPATYSPGFSVDDWVKLLNDSEVFTTGSLEIMKRMKDYGGQATCTQLAVKYGESKNFYNAGSSALARRIADKTGCPVMEDETENSKWWPILYVGHSATKEEQGSYIWRLRDELSAALEKVDLSDIELYVKAAPGEEDRGYWWLNANPKIWSFADIAVGEVQSYTLYNENGNKRRIFQNFLDAKAGDMIIGYESNPVKQIVAIGRVSAEQDGEKLFFEKVEGLTSPIDYATLRGCPELERMEYFQNPQGSLFKLTRGEFDFILDMIREENPVAQEASIDAYTKSDFLDEVYMTEKRYENLVAVLRNKKNIILQGAPGVGKTFAARRLAWSMMGEKDDSRIEFVQFHQNYSYEDFMMGYKPVANAHVR